MKTSKYKFPVKLQQYSNIDASTIDVNENTFSEGHLNITLNKYLFCSE